MAWKTRYGWAAVSSYRLLIDPLISPLRPRITQICLDLKANDVLDIASGTGEQCRRLHRAGIHATGIDFAERMIATARRHSDPGTSFVHGSAYALPFEADSFDACLLLLALHEHPATKRPVMIREALRVLRPGGSLVIADYHEPPRPRAHVPWRMIRFIERHAGTEHSAGFVDYVSRGCLHGLLDRCGLSATLESRSHFGAIGIVTVTRPPESG